VCECVPPPPPSLGVCVCVSAPRQVSAGDSTLSLLPPWHIYQRSVAYYLFSRWGGGTGIDQQH